jgi:hypothetical protein
VRAAERSEKAAIENQKNIFVSTDIAQRDRFSFKIGERKIRGGGMKGDFGQIFDLFRS